MTAYRAFAGLELGRNAIPVETTILNFRHLLERHELTKALFDAVSRHLEDKGALLRGGTIMDATLIAASPSTKNKAGKRDPEMSQSKKGNAWYFACKVHVGVDARSGLVHTAGVTTGKTHDAKVMDNPIREDDRAVFADKGYVNETKKRVGRAQVPRPAVSVAILQARLSCRVVTGRCGSRPANSQPFERHYNHHALSSSSNCGDNIAWRSLRPLPCSTAAS